MNNEEEILIQDRDSITIQQRMTVEEAKRRYPDASGLSDEALGELADELRRREDSK